MRIKLVLSYCGTDFCGWQMQADQCSIQGELTAAIHKLTGESVNVTGSGRTDAGVHALAQVAHFDLSREFLPEKIVSGLNFYLPQDIRISTASVVSEDFHARFSAKKKTYLYLMYHAVADNALLKNRALRVSRLDAEAMQRAADSLVGSHDFSPFMSSGSEVKTTVRTIYTAKISENSGFYSFEVTANGFLYNMVRKLAATLITIGEGKRNASDIANILAQKSQSKDISPPHALYLKDVEY